MFRYTFDCRIFFFYYPPTRRKGDIVKRDASSEERIAVDTTAIKCRKSGGNTGNLIIGSRAINSPGDTP